MEARKFGRYEVVAELGKGAMGTVYRARDPMLNRTVAIKTVNMDLDRDEVEDYEARFYQEARAAGGLNHPNIVTIYDIGKSGTVAYMAMELLAGNELRSIMAQGKALRVGQAIDIAAQAAEGLGYAHDHDVVHRDIKPANLMIVHDGLVKITDFGIARMRTSEVRTQTGVVLGSPRYMSPEQVVGKRAEPRSDIFSLGVILYEMVTGKPPFTGQDVSAIMFQILNFVPPPPSSVNRDAPEMLDFIIAKALAKSPGDRYASAREMASDLRECRQQVPARASSGLALKPGQPSFEPESAIDLLILTAPQTRRSDEESKVLEPAPTLGISKAFDSMAATSRLVIQSGISGEFATSSTTKPTKLGQQGFPGGVGPGWSRWDKLIFTASVISAAVVGAFIVFA
ncbi:MAG: serine/threonine protein kinase [Betaproteobacteria bacterium]|nr:serine/threonine protein kinase [Betaproteobacteria bacterium]MDH3436293.1 serine/threonine protein kinase [Betaproteobacteria bacterium]